jgi:hypothetical protein
LETGAAVVCPSVALCVGVGVRWQLVVEEEGAGVENGLEYDALAELGQTGVTSPTQLRRYKPNAELIDPRSLNA